MRGLLLLWGWGPHFVHPGFIVTCTHQAAHHTGDGLAVSCPLIVGSAGPGMRQCSTKASRISLNCPCSWGSGILYMTGTHTVLLAKASPLPGHLRSASSGGGCVIGPSQQALLITGCLSLSAHREPRSHLPHPSKWEVGFPVSPSL